MKSDLYTKAVLTVIAITLVVIGCKPLISPETTVSAQSAPFAGVQYVGHGEWFDTRTGELWEYSTDGSTNDNLLGKFKLTKLGQPLVKEYDRYAKSRE